jgi:DNA repair protein RecN (Recombination protein N)
MLEELHVSELGVVRDATLELAPGLNVLTGETGAGKTMITVGLALAVGSRASPSMVREGAASLSVEARFRAPEDEARRLAEWTGEEGEAGELVLARSVRADGRSAARMSGRLAPVSSLAEVGRTLVEIHGQNQAQRLLASGAQLAFLDRFAGTEHLAEVHGYRKAFEALQHARAALAALDAAGREQEREKDLLRYQIREIEGAAVRPGELESLIEEERRLAHADRIRELVGGAEDAVGADGGAADRLRQAAAALQGVALLDPSADAIAARLAGSSADVEDALAEVRRYAALVEADPARLGRVGERVRALQDLERKYGDGEEGILTYLAQASERLAELEGREQDRAALTEAVARGREDVRRRAAALSARRAAVAPDLARQLQREVRQLGMPGARFDVELETAAEPGPDGAEEASFAFAGGPGQPSLPLAKAASGGELSRIMLACRSVLADLDEVPTLVFDEVDTGIGGRTAGAVAARLAALATRRQVLVVTHLAQIAAAADRHFAVTKSDGVASVRALGEEDRVVELARMLSGTTGSVSLAHARELMGAGSGGR